MTVGALLKAPASGEEGLAAATDNSIFPQIIVTNDEKETAIVHYLLTLLSN